MPVLQCSKETSQPRVVKAATFRLRRQCFHRPGCTGFIERFDTYLSLSLPKRRHRRFRENIATGEQPNSDGERDHRESDDRNWRQCG